MILLAHLWQSTLCVGVAALLALSLRQAPARIRHRVWLLASAKFLVPFSLLVAAGRLAAPWLPSFVTPHVSVDVHWLDRSSAFLDLGGRRDVLNNALLGDLGVVLTWTLVLTWGCGAAGIAWSRWRTWRALMIRARTSATIEQGREAKAFQRVHEKLPLDRSIALLAWDAPVEPGVLGVLHPRVIWPSGLAAQLTEAELDAILAHELCHVTRRDNAVALVQMTAEALFWFHPVVWWVGARLVSERERACDEEVLKMGTDKRHYAEGILKVCRFCLASPLVGVAGISGSNLALRVARIMQHRPVRDLSRPGRALLASVLGLLIAAPLATGLLDAHRPTLGGEQMPVGALAPETGPTAFAGAAPTTVHQSADARRPTLTRPKVVSEVHPSYTPAAMQAKIQGQVDMHVVVLANGRVGKVTVTRSLDTEHGLDDEAVKAVKQWRFEPGTKDGKPVPVSVDITMTFTLR